MKLQQLSLLIILFVTRSTMGMELTSSDFLFNDAILYIAALAQNNASMNLVNKQCADVVTQKNMLLNFPKGLNRRDHINFMVKSAKNGNEFLIKLGLQTADLCEHDYAMILPLFIPNDSPLLTTITEYKKNPTEKHFKTLLPSIISVYRGDPTAINEYKNKPRETLSSIHNNRVTALHVTVNRRDHLSIAELLLAQNPDLLNQRPLGDNNFNLTIATPLEVAIAYKSLSMCTFLLSFKNIHINTSSPYDKNYPFHDKKNYPFLRWVIEVSNLEIIKLIIDKLKQQQNQEIYSSWLNADALECRMHNKEITLFLLEEIKYDLPSATKPLHIATQGNYFNLVKAICEYPNININAQNENGQTALFIAVDSGFHSLITNLLLNANANPNIPDNKGTTPLMRAVFYGNVTKVELLLTHKADPSIKSLNGKSVYDYSLTPEIKELLIQHNSSKIT